MSEQNLISRKEIYEKYDVDFSVISLVLEMNNIGVERIENRRGMYDEKVFVNALHDLFIRRAAGHRKQAQQWAEKADRIMDVYEGREKPVYEDLVPRFEPDTIGEGGEGP